MATQELIDQLKAHATANYNAGGWDVIVECYDDQQIDAVIGPRVRTLKGAIAKFDFIVDVMAERQADAIISGYGSQEAYEAEMGRGTGTSKVTAADVEAELLATWPADQITDEMREEMTALLTD
jgi:hypothetical protein